jgi:hypothetical protein
MILVGLMKILHMGEFGTLILKLKYTRSAGLLCGTPTEHTGYLKL